MTRSIFDMGFRPSFLGSPRMGISLKEMQEWWKEQYGTFKAAKEAVEGAPQAKPAQTTTPTQAPAPSGGIPGWLLIGGAAALGIGVVIAVVASQSSK